MTFTSAPVLVGVVLALSLSLVGLGAENPPSPARRPLLLYVGTYTGPKSQGIYAFRFDPRTGALTPLGLAAQTVNPTFLALNPRRPLLYAVNEVDEFKGEASGGVSAFALDRATGKLESLNQQPSGGRGPCHLAVDASGRWLAVANYVGGSVALLPLQADGRLAPATSVIQHYGTSANPQRQAGPHAHCVTFDPAGQFVFACDLGLDKVLSYRLDPDQGLLHPNTVPWASVPPGAGPRHLCFTPDGRHAYLICEMGSRIIAFAYEPAQGALDEVQSVSTLPDGFRGRNTAAEIAVHPSGKFLYGSNRGDDSLAVFALEGRTGQLTLRQRVASGGKTPRHFALDPTGRWLLAANQDSDNLVVFRLDRRTGKLTPIGHAVTLGAPVCVTFVP